MCPWPSPSLHKAVICFYSDFTHSDLHAVSQIFLRVSSLFLTQILLTPYCLLWIKFSSVRTVLSHSDFTDSELFVFQQPDFGTPTRDPHTSTPYSRQWGPMESCLEWALPPLAFQSLAWWRGVVGSCGEDLVVIEALINLRTSSLRGSHSRIPAVTSILTSSGSHPWSKDLTVHVHAIQTRHVPVCVAIVIAAGSILMLPATGLCYWVVLERLSCVS